MQLLRVNARNQCEIARDHQPLDVMGICFLAGLGYAGFHACHIGFTRPVKGGQIPVGR